jgi:quinol monooxygenase YgiN
MGRPIHIAMTRRVRKTHIAQFEHALADFASRFLAEPGARGVHCLHPPPGSSSTEYGIMRSFASAADRDALYQMPLYQEWLDRICGHRRHPHMGRHAVASQSRALVASPMRHIKSAKRKKTITSGRGTS